MLSLAWTLAAATAVAQSPKAPEPCGMPVAHQLDFWIGEWEVLSGGAKIATSRIERASGGCAIHESYRQSDGFEGQSLSFHDAHLHAWRQTWTDSAGGVGEFRGEASSGEMRFTGETDRADGSRVLRRMTLTRVDNDRVRQHSLTSTDEGRTWKPHYDFTYLRRSR